MRIKSVSNYRGIIAVMAAFAVITALLAQACTGEPTATPTQAPTATPVVVEDAPTSTPDAQLLSGLLATTDLGVGDNRISFLLIGPDNIVTVPDVSVASRNVSTKDSSEVVVENANASFRLWPFGTRGSYVTSLTFDEPGEWELDVEVTNEDGSVDVARIPLEVKETSFTPSIGSSPPMAVNRTLSDVILLNELTSWSTPDPDLYMETIPRALEEDQPVLVVFSSPSLCTSPTCGPQIETVQEVKNRFKDQARFIHVEVYDNPAEIQGDLSKARYSPVVDAWGLTQIEDYFNESWVFIMGLDDLVMFKYEGYTSAEELEEGLTQALQSR